MPVIISTRRSKYYSIFSFFFCFCFCFLLRPAFIQLAKLPGRLLRLTLFTYAPVIIAIHCYCCSCFFCSIVKLYISVFMSVCLAFIIMCRERTLIVRPLLSDSTTLKHHCRYIGVFVNIPPMLFVLQAIYFIVVVVAVV